MCAPMTMKTTDIMFEGVIKYAREYKKYEGKTEQQIEGKWRQLDKPNGYLIGD